LSGDKPEPTCALVGCNQTFVPNRPSQKYCTPAHAQKASNIRRYPARTLTPLDPVEGVSLEDAINAAERAGYLVHKPTPSAPVVSIDPGRIRGKKRVRLGILSDWHAGSKFQQPTYLREHYARMRRRGIDALLAPGDLTDGSTAMHAGFEYELWAHGFDAQVDAAADMVPQDKIEKFLIGGNHDASHTKADGGDPIRAIAEKRRDMTYLSPGEGNHQGSIGYVRFGDVLVQMCHPHLGGTRVRSYRMERWIEELTPENKPHVVIMGNFHKVLQQDYRNVFGLMVPSYQAQSTWMASKGISSYIGGCILEFGYETRGIAPSIQVEWLIERIPKENDWP
jgi:predicted phosphodiesterase